MNQLSETLSDAAQDALKAASANPTEQGISNALEHLGTTIVTAAASAANPLAGAAARLAAPLIMHQIATALVQIFKHVGAAVPAALNDAIEKLEEVIHVDLNGDGEIGDGNA